MALGIRSRTVKVVINIVVGVLFFLGMHLAGKKLALDFMDHEKKSFDQSQDQIKAQQELINANREAKKQAEEIKSKLQELDQKSVGEKELPRIIQQLSRKSGELGIEIISIKPLKESAAQSSEVPAGINKTYIEVMVKGSYRSITDYIKALDELPITFTVESLLLDKFAESLGPASGRLQGTLVLSSYSLKT